MSLTITPIGASSGSWVPTVGARTRAFVQKKTSGENALSEPSMETVLSEASDILGNCVAPTVAVGSTAVLAVGYVQSGKTLSFTTVTALARDNGFGIVIVLAGTTNNLKGQSEDRLVKDLGLEDLQRDWRHVNNPDQTGSSFDDIQKTLTNWDRYRQGLASEEKPALLITILKHSHRLSGAAAVLADLPLTGVPVLVIDDESDQAGLNTKARKNLLNGTSDESGTYEAINALRNALPQHSYLQYTATPQANLLLAAADTLNPAYAKVISSGSGYTGGQTFFQDRKADLIVQVRDTEIFNPKEPFDEPPPALQDALRVFLLGIANGAAEDGKSNRSMMVQAHQNTDPHKLFYSWISNLLKAWSDGIANESTRPDVSLEFADAWNELSRTVPDLAPLAELIRRLPEKIADVRTVIVNSTGDAEKKIEWKKWFYWILIGGQKLDRGFTVEGLTVTYMPRQVSDNADVLQQRARFFGYRAGYIDFCRVYLIKDAIEAFEGYVEDEEFLRASLRDHEGRPLTDWKRDFILHRQIARPTRANVVGRRSRRLPLRDGWTWPKSMHIDDPAIESNTRLFAELRAEAQGHLQDGATLPGVTDRRSGQRHMLWPDISLQRLTQFLIDVRYGAVEDSLLSTAFEMALARQIRDSPNARAAVVFMNDLERSSGLGRKLDVLRGNIHIGMNPTGAVGDQVQYSGDRSFAATDRITVQLRSIDLSYPARPGGGQYSNIPWLAVHLPTNVANDAWLDLD